MGGHGGGVEQRVDVTKIGLGSERQIGCSCSIHIVYYVCCLLVVLVKLSVLAK